MPLDVPEPLRQSWGLRWLGGVLEVCPDLSQTDLPALHRLRCGRTLIDLAVRERPGRTSVRIARRFGPPLAVRVRLPGSGPVHLTVDEHPVDGTQASLLVEGEHEIAFYR